MVATIRTWAYDSNYAVLGGTFDAQSADVGFRIHEVIRGGVGVDLNGTSSSAGGWTVVNSYDGVGGAPFTGNNILDSGDIVSASGAVDHSWAEYSPPTALITGKTPRLVLDWNKNTPFSQVSMFMFPGTPTVAGTATARPTHTNEVGFSLGTWFPDTTFVARTVHGWRTSIGELIIILARNGLGYPSAGIWIPRFDSGEAACVWPFNFWFASSEASPQGATSSSQIVATANWRGFWQSDIALSASKQVSSPLADKSQNWTLGRSNISNDLGDAHLAMTWDGSNQSGFPGYIVDVRATPGSAASNQDQSGDTDLQRRMTVGGLWVPWRSAAGAIQF